MMYYDALYSSAGHVDSFYRYEFNVLWEGLRRESQAYRVGRHGVFSVT